MRALQYAGGHLLAGRISRLPCAEREHRQRDALAPLEREGGEFDVVVPEGRERVNQTMITNQATIRQIRL